MKSTYNSISLIKCAHDLSLVRESRHNDLQHTKRREDTHTNELEWNDVDIAPFQNRSKEKSSLCPL